MHARIDRRRSALVSWRLPTVAMPRFVFLGRHCRVGSDDFYLPAIICCACRSLIILLAVLYISELRTCSTMQFNPTGCGFWFANGTIILYLFLIGNEALILHISSQGTIANCEHRVLLQPALLVRSFTLAIELVYACLGVYFASEYIPCWRDLIIVMVCTLINGKQRIVKGSDRSFVHRCYSMWLVQ